MSSLSAPQSPRVLPLKLRHLRFSNPPAPGARLLVITFGLEVVAIVLLVDGVGIRFLNYALYCGFIAAGVLTLIDLPQPSNYAAEGYRVLWTLCGVAIGVLVMLLAGLLAKRKAKTPQPAPQPA